ncbi:D-lyxose/D-mannose family sugar isomerase [Paracoccus pacificus]|uniref:D-lyxose ketol-isomerase n=1 Tax=Paracoccus pacificus TaxID=1463598 RepID=A0ABW4R5R8_9RHOB
MKRSEINRIMADAKEMIRAGGFALPPFAFWTPEEFSANLPAARRIVDAQMGWDITDYAQGDFSKTGLFLFTLRNGDLAELNASRGMVYAEKLLISREGQVTPMHTHVIKTEDIINRSGATLAIQLYGSDAAGAIDHGRGVTVDCDGIARKVAAGDILRLAPGESVTLRPGDWHAFWGEGGSVLVGEVSTVNDDLTDNIFEADIGRFAEIDEDEAPTHLLVSDYDAWLGPRMV